LVKGANVQLREFTLQSPTRNGTTLGSAYGIKTNPNGDNTVDSTGLVITNVTVRDMKMSGIDLNGASGAVLTNITASNIASGFGIAISGSSSNIDVIGLAVTNAVWGDAVVQPYNAIAPVGIRFSGVLSLSAIQAQPTLATAMVVSTGSSTDSGYNSAANVFVPASFNRAVSTTRADGQMMIFGVPQSTVSALTAALTSPTFSTPVVSNILGNVEVIHSGVAIAGRAALNMATIGLAVAGDTIQVEAGNYPLSEKIILDGVSLVGAGMNSTVFDMSTAPMASNEQGMLLFGNAVTLRDFTLTSPNRTGSTGSAYGIKTGPSTTPANCTNLVVTNVKVDNIKKSGFDFNTTLGGTFTNLVASNISGGYGVSIAGAASNLSFTGVTITACAWGDVGVFPWPASSADRPSGIQFNNGGAGLNFNTINVQPYTTTIAISTTDLGSPLYNALAQIFVPADFDRVVSTIRTSDSLAMNFASRSGYTSTLLAAIATGYNSTNVANILGQYELVRNGLAIAGYSTLAAANNAAQAGDVVFEDSDLDSIADASDNCVNVANSSQANTDSDPRGDACDCDPTNAAIYQGATEICDGLDNDCSGGVDNGLATFSFYPDADNDGFGSSSASATVSCSAAVSGVINATQNNTDCNDGAFAINPGVAEICDAGNVDENCNGLADNADSGATTATKTAFYADSDNDGYSTNTGSLFCDLPATGYEVAAEGDCNDASTAVYPGAVELCATVGTDNNCNSDATDVDTDAADKLTFYTDADNDNFGTGAGARFCTEPAFYATVAGDCNDADATVNTPQPYFVDGDGDGFGSTTATTKCSSVITPGFSLSSTDCNDAVATTYPGAAELCNGIDDDCNTVIDNGLALINVYLDTDNDGFGSGPALSTQYCSGPEPNPSLSVSR
jgi:hypothetical protein